MLDFVANELDYIYFMLGLIFIVFGLIGTFFIKKYSVLSWKWFFLFSILHGLVEWANMLWLSMGVSISSKIIIIWLWGLSLFCLIEFGRTSLYRLEKIKISKYFYVPFIVIAFFGIWKGFEPLSYFLSSFYGFIEIFLAFLLLASFLSFYSKKSKGSAYIGGFKNDKGLLTKASLVMILVFSLGWVFTHHIGNITSDEIKKNIENASAITSKIVHLDDIKKIMNTPEHSQMKEYLELRRDLKYDEVESHYLWTYIMYLKGEEVYFLLDTDPETDYSVLPIEDSIYKSPPKEVFQLFKEGGSTVVGPYLDEFGTFLSGMTAIKDENGKIVAVIGLDIDMVYFQNRIFVSRVTPIVVVLLICFIFIGFLLSRQRVLEASKKIEENEAQLIEAQKVALMGSFTLNIRNEQLSWSKEMFHIHKRQEHLGSPNMREYRRYFYPDDLVVMDKNIFEAILTGEEHEYEHRLIFENGEMKYFNSRINAKLNADGEVEFLVGITQDITARKQTELALSRNLLFMQTLIDSLPYPIYYKDMNAKFLGCNTAFQKFFNVTHSGILGKTSLDIGKNDYSVQQHTADLELLSHKGIISYETPFSDHADKMYTLLVIESTFCDENENVSGLIGAYIDVSDHKTMEEALILAKNEAEKANAAKSEFLANMSHEIRTPLNAVIGFSELLVATTLDLKQRSYVEAINTGGKSLLTLINDILDLSKIEAGMMEIQLAPVNPKNIFNELEQIFRQKIRSKNLDFIIDIEENIPQALLLDETRLRQVLLNLVGNAVKFTDKGSITLRVKKLLKDKNDGSRLDLIVEVSDTGIGIPKDQYDTIFQSFKQQQGQSSRKYGGTGLGLSITKKLVEMMNGKVSVSSEIGKGSTFLIELFDVDVSASHLIPSEDSSLHVNNIYFEKAVVLVVDDVSSNRTLIKEMLSAKGLEVISAENGYEGTINAKEIMPDLIIMDIRMPVMDGYEACEIIKKNEKTKNIPIIALTASTFSGIDDDKRDLLFDGFLPKPVSSKRLLEELSKYLKTTKSDDFIEDVKENTHSTYENENTSEEAVKLIKTELYPFAKKLEVVLKTTQVKELCKKLLEAGNNYNMGSLIECSKALDEALKTFDVNVIKENIIRVSELLLKLMKN